MTDTEDAPNMSAARALVEALLAQGVDHVFCVPGESYLAVLDALADYRDRIRVITCRHEAGAANMAEAYGKLTGRPGICMVTRGPGATHASIGVHTAQQDSTPMILFVGQIARGDRGRGAFQEVDYQQMFGSVAKWAVELDDATRVDEIVHRAFSTALQGRRGPVVVALPEDMLVEAVAPSPFHPVAIRASGLTSETALAIAERLETAERPLMILGGSGWDNAALSALEGWADALRLPVLLSFRRKDLWDNEHHCYVGDIGLGTNPKLLARVKSADLLLTIGARLGENASQGYTLFSRQEAAEKLIHILPDPGELGRVWPAAIGAVAELSEAALTLSQMPVRRRWDAWRQAGRTDYEKFSAPIAVSGPVNLSEIFQQFQALLGPNAIICNGAGNYAAWLHRFHRHRSRPTQLAPTSGAMGYGFPASIAAKLLLPDRDVIAVAGDGCFLMSSQELATAVQYGANIIVIVVDNGSYGTIRMHQETHYPGRKIATDLRNPDFVAYARAFGAWSTRVERTEDFPAALAEARAAGAPALIHVVTSIEDIAPGRTLSAAHA
ncbi:MAG: thiamine pyrophosphate-binding protein [Rhodospirillales bacterium]|nr:thiamine pyrophosphate-binding protein [Rhodospirillales bacterium]